MGHELVHVSQIAYLGSIGTLTKLFKDETISDGIMEFYAYGYQNTLVPSPLNSFSSAQIKNMMNLYPKYFKSLNYMNFKWTFGANYVGPE